jgi:hypothetical protein
VFCSSNTDLPALYTYHPQCVHLYLENGEQVLKRRPMRRPRIVSAYAAPVFVLWIHSSHITFSLPDERAAVRFKNTQIPLAFCRARYRIFSIPGEHALFCVRPHDNRLVQYSDLAGQVVRVWLGQDDDGPSRQLPGWSPSSYIGLEADIEKRDAVVAAFRVRHRSLALLAPWLTRVSSMRGWHMVRGIFCSPPSVFNMVVAERDAMGADEYHPISRQGSNLTEEGGIGYTVVDALDTMLIMGLDEEYQRARSWVAEEMTFDRDADLNTFEVRPFCTAFVSVCFMLLRTGRLRSACSAASSPRTIIREATSFT